jgi:hypothetical protein
VASVESPKLTEYPVPVDLDHRNEQRTLGPGPWRFAAPKRHNELAEAVEVYRNLLYEQAVHACNEFVAGLGAEVGVGTDTRRVRIYFGDSLGVDD